MSDKRGIVLTGDMCPKHAKEFSLGRDDNPARAATKDIECQQLSNHVYTVEQSNGIERVGEQCEKHTDMEGQSSCLSANTSPLRRGHSVERRRSRKERKDGVQDEEALDLSYLRPQAITKGQRQPKTEEHEKAEQYHLRPELMENLPDTGPLPAGYERPRGQALPSPNWIMNRKACLQQDLEELSQELEALKLMCTEVRLQRQAGTASTSNRVAPSSVQAGPQIPSHRIDTRSHVRAWESVSGRREARETSPQEKYEDLAATCCLDNMEEANEELADPNIAFEDIPFPGPEFKTQSNRHAITPFQEAQCVCCGPRREDRLSESSDSARNPLTSSPGKGVSMVTEVAKNNVQAGDHCSQLVNDFQELRNAHSSPSSSNTSAYNTGSSNQSTLQTKQDIVIIEDLKGEGEKAAEQEVDETSRRQRELPKEARHEDSARKQRTKFSKKKEKGKTKVPPPVNLLEVLKAGEGWKSARANTSKGSDKTESNAIDSSFVAEKTPRLGEVMFTNEQNLKHTMEIQQKLFIHDLIQRQLKPKQKPVAKCASGDGVKQNALSETRDCPQTKPRNGKTKSDCRHTSRKTDHKPFSHCAANAELKKKGGIATPVDAGETDQETDQKPSQQEDAERVAAKDGSVSAQLEWVVKVRADGTQYVTRRPVRNRLLKERARRITAERSGRTTDEDAHSEWKLGRYWSKAERRKHLERARERKQRHQQKRDAAKGTASDAKRGETKPAGDETGSMGFSGDHAKPTNEPILKLWQKKMLRQKGKSLFDDFTTLDELMAHGCPVKETTLMKKHGATRKTPALLSVTTV